MADLTRVITFSLDQELSIDLNGTVIELDGEEVTFQGDSVTFDGEDVIW